MNEILLIVAAIVCTLFVLLAWRISAERLYTVIVVCLILIAALGGKLVAIFGHETNTGNVYYAAAFLATYFVIERFGKARAMRSIWIATTAIVFFTILAQITISYEGSPSTATFNDALTLVFGGSLQVTLASLLAFIVAQTCNVRLYAYFRERYENRFLWLRATGANALAQAIDSVIFFTVAFWGVVAPANIVDIIVTGFAIKVVYMALAAPLLYLNNVEQTEEKGFATVVVR